MPKTYHNTLCFLVGLGGNRPDDHGCVLHLPHKNWKMELEHLDGRLYRELRLVELHWYSTHDENYENVIPFSFFPSSSSNLHSFVKNEINDKKGKSSAGSGKL